MRPTSLNSISSLGSSLSLISAVLQISGCGLDVGLKKNLRGGGALTRQSSPPLAAACLGEPDFFSRTLHTYVRTASCVNCHGQSQIPLFAVGNQDAAYSESLPLIDSLTPSNSRIVKKGADGHCGSSCLDSSNLLQSVHSWLDARVAGGCALPTQPIPSSTPTPVATPAPSVTVRPTPTPTPTPSSIPGVSTQCKAFTLFQRNVKPILKAQCFSCHSGGAGGYTMSTSDDGDLCTNALPLIDVNDPANSPLIVRPLTHQRHPNIGFQQQDAFPKWIDWIQAEQ